MTIRVLIVDDHAILRAGLRRLINDQSDMAVIDEAADGSEAVRKAQDTQPDVVVLDLSMPMSGLQALPLIRERCPKTRVVALTMHQDPAYLRAVFDAGGTGYVLKKAADTDLLNAIRAVASGRIYVCPFCRDFLVQSALGLDTPGQEAGPCKAASQLSKREREVLLMVAQGYTNRQVAERLDLSVKSVESYRARLLEKLGLQTRVELHRYALASGLLRADGLIEPDPPAGL